MVHNIDCGNIYGIAQTVPPLNNVKTAKQTKVQAFHRLQQTAVSAT